MKEDLARKLLFEIEPVLKFVFYVTNTLQISNNCICLKDNEYKITDSTVNFIVKLTNSMIYTT